jgi:cellulose synthase/poly-beta-1,6-N-acetylglucosamine synthase-like glycosyltransferase
MPPSPLVSVVMTVWNGEKFIGESVQSILGQTFTDFELIVVDDGSEDGTCALVESYQDSRLQLFRRPHEGIVSSANFGISQSRGKYIARLDADDLSLPKRLEMQVGVLEQHPSAVLCYTDIEIFGDLTELNEGGIFITDGGLVALKMCYGCYLVHSSVLYRKDAFQRAGRYLVKTPVAEDYSLFTRLIREGTFIGIPQKLVKYRRTLTSATYRHFDEMARIAKEISIEHIHAFLGIKSPMAECVFENLRHPPAKRHWRLWLFFCWTALRRPSSWNAEPLGWMFLQTLKMLFRNPAN